jgi:selenocysteine lyase/cysteine desulfurase
MSRRHFLGGTAAAVGAFSLRGLPAALEAQSTVPPVAVPLSQLKPAGALDEAYWWKVRGQFNLVDGFTFMNNGTLGPTPRAVLETSERVAREISEDPSNGYREADRDVVRQHVAAFVGATVDEIALLRSTSEGMNVFTHGIDWRPGDEVLMCTHEHGGGTGPYRTLEARRGIKIKTIDVPAPPSSVDQIVSLYDKAITPKTRVIMVSHITYVTGLVMPVRELSDLAHRRGLLISVDGAHPVGMMEVSFKEIGCDHYSAAGQKWLLAGTGTGICYIRRDLQDQIWPLMGYVDPKSMAANVRGARKYESNGQKHVPSVLGMAAAMDLQETIGRKNIEARVRSLSQRVREGLEDIPGVKMWTSPDPRFSAALTLFSIRDIPMDNIVKAMMARERVFIRTMSTGNLNAVRVSTHFYNMPEEVDRLLRGVKYISENASKFTSTAA